MQIAPFLFVYAVPLLSLIGLCFQGPWFWLAPAFAFLCIPIIDYFFGNDHSDFKEPTPFTVRAGRALTVLFVPLQVLLIGYGSYQAAHSEWTNGEWALAVFSVGMCAGGLGITVAHELVHRNEKILRFLGGILLSTVCYGHFMVEHVHGHHTWVATPRDPASSRLGETVYAFYIRTVLGCFISALAIEKNWLKKKNRSFVHNRVYLTFLASFVFAAIIFVLLGFKGLLFFMLQAWIAFTFLEIINYVEHYGLSRKEVSPGVFEPVSLQHSWDSRRKVSNWFLINLEHHSDHHKYPSRDFTRLRFHPEAPLLPAGYPEMFLLSLCPPLWFSIMNPRVPNSKILS